MRSLLRTSPPWGNRSSIVRRVSRPPLGARTGADNVASTDQTTLNRTVFLRYAPEMQGTWNLYGNQPTGFVASWQAMYAAVKAVAPETIMVWAPNTPQG